MRHFWDFEYIDNAKWPGKGPVYSLFEFNRQMPMSGVCQFVCAGDDRVMRSRIYEVRVDGKLSEVIVTDVEKLRRGQPLLRVTQPFSLLSIAYSRMLGLDPEQCIFPAGFYSARAERRAQLGPWREMTRDEIHDRTTWVTQQAQRAIAAKRRGCANENRTGIYCFDRDKEALVDQEIARIDELVDVALSAKVRALLEKSKPDDIAAVNG